jgi:glutathione S-transferase
MMNALALFVLAVLCNSGQSIQNLFKTKQQKIKIKAPEGFVAPEPKPLSVADGNYIGALTGAFALGLRLGTGVFVTGWEPVNKNEGPWPGTLGKIRDGSATLGSCNRPKQPIVVYEYEGSPFCRKVREACALLDLTVEYRPCPGARYGWSDSQATLTGGKRTVPFMMDPNAVTSKSKNSKAQGWEQGCSPDQGMFESDDIINYLFDTYGPGRQAVPWTLKGPFATITCALASLVRGFAGSKPFTSADGSSGIRNDVTTLEPIIFYGYEGSPFVKPVREALVSLGLSHTMVYCARGSSNRDVLFVKTGRFQVPYIEDPNTGVNMFESGEIVKYLESTYAK